MSKFFKLSLAMLAGMTTSFALLGSSILYASDSSSDHISTEKIIEVADQVNGFSQLEVSFSNPSHSENESFHSIEEDSLLSYGINFGQVQGRHDSHESHEKNKSRLLHMTLTISATVGTVPVGYNVDVTPFAISPQGKKYVGASTNIPISGSAIVQPLNGVFVPHLIEGTYTVGYDVRLGVGSPLPVGNLGAIFNDIVLTKHVFGLRKETVNSGFVALLFSDLTTPSDVLTVSANCQLLHPEPNKETFERTQNSVTINMSVLYGIATPPIPNTSNFNFTPFAIAPNGKVFRGTPTNIVLGSSNFVGIPLNPVTISHPIFGNYFVGYEISLGNGSSPAAAGTTYNFFGNIRSNPVDTIRESVTFPTQLLPLGPLLTPSDFIRVTGNFVISKP